MHGLASCAYGIFGMNFLLDEAGQPSGGLVPNPSGETHGAFILVSIFVATLCVLAWLGLVWGFRAKGMIHIVALPALRAKTGGGSGASGGSGNTTARKDE